MNAPFRLALLDVADDLDHVRRRHAVSRTVHVELILAFMDDHLRLEWHSEAAQIEARTSTVVAED